MLVRACGFESRPGHQARDDSRCATSGPSGFAWQKLACASLGPQRGYAPKLAIQLLVRRVELVANSNVASFPDFDENPISQDDFKAVRALLDDVRGERALQLAKAIVAWLAAFDVFKKLDARIGLPVSSESKLACCGIVAQPKGAGKWILMAAGQNAKVLECLEIQYVDIASRVKELSWDDDWVENPISAAEREQLAAVFGG